MYVRGAASLRCTRVTTVIPQALTFMVSGMPRIRNWKEDHLAKRQAVFSGSFRSVFGETERRPKGTLTKDTHILYFSHQNRRRGELIWDQCLPCMHTATHKTKARRRLRVLPTSLDAGHHHTCSASLQCFPIMIFSS
ncbi:hypothetical protein SAICODRAFT_128435 [Saitoella complicata NRRL Y-17804]|uniref:uncharacterized protein n=1 Tax=Saitoella complicata (strain BCRC 22490 / CBS 7301 / JCM 7358 / NBRC 10748 / NRRL Y-17804) TaxID=698492 RepID=UPI000867996B|nr:uncharacterized protein SAICODRAFT_128435 [Saitoella complicata NRRL Y-17804]ODQ52835.1 hypothetical protein SAICODRAFT_128435 [Saitoella complicata NRRL Y-17804]